MMLTPIEQIAMANDATRSIAEKKRIMSKREIFWQRTLRTFIPEGLNKREG